jgi:peptidyl-prolyl cis-trans isomerase A (cyclophilin A)
MNGRSAWPGYAVVALMCGAAGWSVLTGGGASCATREPADPFGTAAQSSTPPSPEVTNVGGLVLEDLVVGTGAAAQAGDRLTVHYVGTLADGTEFDSSRKRGQPFDFELGAGRVIKGWDQGVAGMRVGGKRRLTIPPDLGYGGRGAPPKIPANATLVFEIELLEMTAHGGGSTSFSLAKATEGLKGTGPIVAKIDTSKGRLDCRLYDDKAPLTVANFIGLATGKRAWKDPRSGEWVNKPAYDGTTFHRVIKGFMIQGGDPLGTGAGEPGYTFKDEIWQGAKHDRAGLLCMANRGPNTNGAQFFIMDAPAAHLDGGYTVFGECAPVEVVHEIANVPTGPSDKPVSSVTIKTVTISRLQ